MEVNIWIPLVVIFGSQFKETSICNVSTEIMDLHVINIQTGSFKRLKTCNTILSFADYKEPVMFVLFNTFRL